MLMLGSILSQTAVPPYAEAHPARVSKPLWRDDRRVVRNILALTAYRPPSCEQTISATSRLLWRSPLENIEAPPAGTVPPVAFGAPRVKNTQKYGQLIAYGNIS